MTRLKTRMSLSIVQSIFMSILIHTWQLVLGKHRAPLNDSVAAHATGDSVVSQRWYAAKSWHN